MTGWQWALLIGGGWLLLTLVVGLTVGRVIRNRDRQDPKPPHVEPEIPQQRARPPRRPQQWPPWKHHNNGSN